MNDQRGISFNEQKKYKFILVGDSTVGKTALFWRFIQGQFTGIRTQQLKTVDFKIKTIAVRGKQAKLYIWDTAGQQKYRSIVSTYFKGCHGTILVFDVTKPQTFENATKSWFPLCQTKAQSSIIFLVGNKSDLQPVIPLQKIKSWAKQKNIRLIFTSAKSGLNVEQLFQQLTLAVFDKLQKPQKKPSFVLGAQNKNNKKSKCCK